MIETIWEMNENELELLLLYNEYANMKQQRDKIKLIIERNKLALTNVISLTVCMREQIDELERKGFKKPDFDVSKV